MHQLEDMLSYPVIALRVSIRLAAFVEVFVLLYDKVIILLASGKLCFKCSSLRATPVTLSKAQVPQDHQTSVHKTNVLLATSILHYLAARIDNLIDSSAISLQNHIASLNNKLLNFRQFVRGTFCEGCQRLLQWRLDQHRRHELRVLAYHAT